MTTPKAKPRHDHDEREDDSARVEADVDPVLTKIGDVLEKR
jgi:hypothetical protein